MDRLRIIPLRMLGAAGQATLDGRGCPKCRDLEAVRAQLEALQQQLQAECRLALARQQEIEKLQQQLEALQKRNRELEARAGSGSSGGAVTAGSAAGEGHLASLCSAPSIAKIPLDAQWSTRRRAMIKD